MEPLSDEELLSNYRAHAGSPEAGRWLNELFQRHHARVALWCLRLTGDRQSAADLAQEVFLKAFRYLDSYRGDSKFSTWLYSITRNHCYSEIKGRAAAPQQIAEPVLADLVDQSPNQHSQLERESSARVLSQLIQGSLTDLETQVMTLHFVEELPLDAVTRLLNLQNTSGAKAYIVSAKRKLTQAFGRLEARQNRTQP
jgi:RNA polymerase sigma-70 factor, ECF subfamily